MPAFLIFANECEPLIRSLSLTKLVLVSMVGNVPFPYFAYNPFGFYIYI